MVQEHHSGEGFSDLGGAGICAFGWGRGMPSFGPSLPLSPGFADPLAGHRERGGNLSAGL